MAIDYKEFKHSGGGLITGMKANDDYTRFLYRFKLEGSPKRKIFSFLNQTGWNKKMRITKTNEAASEYRKEIYDSLFNQFSPDTKMDIIAKEFFEKEVFPDEKVIDLY